MPARENPFATRLVQSAAEPIRSEYSVIICIVRGIIVMYLTTLLRVPDKIVCTINLKQMTLSGMLIVVSSSYYRHYSAGRKE